MGKERLRTGVHCRVPRCVSWSQRQRGEGSRIMTRYLVVSHLTAGSPEFQKQIRSLVQKEPDAEFTLLVPTSPPGHRLIWNDAEAMRAARYRADAAGTLMRECGANVTRTAVGARDPLSAIDDEVREHSPYDAIIICTLPAGVSRWLHLDLVSRARHHTGLPVTHVIAQQEWVPPEPAAGVPETAQSGVVEEAAPAPPREPSEVTAELMTAVGAGMELAGASMAFEQAVRGIEGLDPQLAALVALRVAHLKRCQYAWQEAVAVARGLGIADERITALEHWRSSERVHFDERERAVLGYVEAIIKGGSGGERSARETLAALAPESLVVGLTLLVGFARTQADLATAFALSPREPFVGWDLYVGQAAATL
ncbi:MAG: hypothetical protein C0506_09850 [Anaerolinea sp.]|nr:hypothetical protein [Anaerolinea sp.]